MPRMGVATETYARLEAALLAAIEDHADAARTGPHPMDRASEIAAPVFVFGSNLAGRHGKGAALWARQNRGATYGQGIGIQGNSYAIPTKGHRLETLPLRTIAAFVHEFLIYAHKYHMLRFQVTPIGCGLAGYKPEQIAPMFRKAPDNVELPPEFAAILKEQDDGK